MKIVDRKTFLAMPAGVLFAKVDNSGAAMFGELSVKHETQLAIGDDSLLHRDFWERRLVMFEFDSTGDFIEQWEALERGEPAPINESLERDGLFEADARFLVYELEDLKKLSDTIMHAILVAEIEARK